MFLPTRLPSLLFVCRDAGAFKSYISHLRSACEFISLFSPSEYAVTRDSESQGLAAKIGVPLAFFFCVFAWVSMLCAKIEGTGLRFVSEHRDILDGSARRPGDDRDWVGKFGS